jgi:exopolysaccharide biosynthesis polyprenyl glycosylphosphotransferase
MASEPIVTRAQADYQSRPEAFRHARPRGSITEATLTSAMMMTSDVLAVLLALWLASLVRFGDPTAHWPPTMWSRAFRSFSPGYLLFFTATLLIVNRQFGLYGLRRKQKSWHEHRRTIQACLATGLLLCDCMYVMHNTTASRAIVAYLIGFTTVLLCVARTTWRHFLYLRHQRGEGTKNVLIVGPNHLGNVLRKHITQQDHLGRNFKGFIGTADGGDHHEAGSFLIGELGQWHKIARQHFTDEIIIADQCKTSTIIELIETARELGVEVLAVLGYHGGEMPADLPIDYLGDFPVVPLHRRNDKAVARLLKRLWDLAAASAGLLVVSPAMFVIAVMIKLDSPGPVLYISERIGRRGRTFSCLKFRTMVIDADQLKHSLEAQNERDGPLFKMTNDPRITRVGRFLRKFSLDELPQLLNVIYGDMSLVGPRPPIANEVKLYELQHLRRLEVLPGLTGLWQVRARQDPSFDRYVALDLTYVENWTLWLDLKILARTAQVVFRGTGS